MTRSRRWASVVLAVGISASALAATTSTEPARARNAAPHAGAHPAFGVFGDYVALSGDFDGDHRDDVFWYAPGAAADSVWFGGADRQFTAVGEKVDGTYRPFVGDIDDDGIDDIVWHRPGHRHGYIWTGNADRTFTTRPFGSPIEDVHGFAGDFNGDGHTDILWYGRGAVPDEQWMNDGTGHYTGRTLTITGDYRLMVGNFNGDARTDVFFSSTQSLLHSYLGLARADGTIATHVVPLPNTHKLGGALPFALHANSDARDDLFFYGPGSAEDWLWYSSTTETPISRVATEINGSDYRPVSGDFDGNGRDDVFWYAPGAAADAIWFDVAHDIPAPRGANPVRRWAVDKGTNSVVDVTVDDTLAFALLADRASPAHTLHAYDRRNGLPVWSRAAPCARADNLRRQLEILKVDCDNDVFVYTAATGALRYHQARDACPSDTSYYDVRFLNGHLTVVAARTGATVWQSPVTTHPQCALSGTRLMVVRGVRDGVREYDVLTHHLMVDYPKGHVWRFGPRGYVAMCAADDEEHVVGLSPSGSIAWTTPFVCAGHTTTFGLAPSTSNLISADLDIVTGRLLGTVPTLPQPVERLIGSPLADDAVAYWQVNDQPPIYCWGPSSGAWFYGPYGASPLLPTASSIEWLVFSRRAMAVQLPGGSCYRTAIAAWDQRGFVRWVMPQYGVTPEFIGPYGSDRATNGGDEASALLGVNTVDDDLTLMALP